ncbi:MAG: hypothetical protein WD273_12360 [Trueperaceae bacterium]
MAEAVERRRILDMLAGGQINADEAEELLGAVDGSGDETSPVNRDVARHVAILDAVRGARKDKAKTITRSLRIIIDAGDEEYGNRGHVSVTVPLALAKFAGKLIPQDVRLRLEDEGIELAELLQALDEELPEGRLVDIDTNPEGDMGRRARIVVEVA